MGREPMFRDESKPAVVNPIKTEEPLRLEDLVLEDIKKFLDYEWKKGDPKKKAWIYKQIKEHFPNFLKTLPDASTIKWPTPEDLEEDRKYIEELKKRQREEEKEIA